MCRLIGASATSCIATTLHVERYTHGSQGQTRTAREAGTEMSTIIPVHIERPFPHIEDDDVYEDDEDDD